MNLAAKVLAGLFALLLAAPASAQTNPGFTPTLLKSSVLNQAFAQKMDYPGTGFLPGATINTIGRLGIGPRFTGSVVPDSLLEVNANTQNTPGSLLAGTVFHVVGAAAVSSRFIFDTFAGSGNFSFRRANGTITSPSAVQFADVIGIITGFGYGTTGYSPNNRVSINFLAGENWTDTAQGTSIQINTTANGGISTTERVRIWGSGGVSIGITSDPGASNLIVAGAISSAGLPTSAGSGGLNVCVDTAGVFYKKASCP